MEPLLFSFYTGWSGEGTFFLIFPSLLSHFPLSLKVNHRQFHDKYDSRRFKCLAVTISFFGSCVDHLLQYKVSIGYDWGMSALSCAAQCVIPSHTHTHTRLATAWQGQSSRTKSRYVKGTNSDCVTISQRIQLMRYHDLWSFCVGSVFSSSASGTSI